MEMALLFGSTLPTSNCSSSRIRLIHPSKSYSKSSPGRVKLNASHFNGVEVTDSSPIIWLSQPNYTTTKTTAHVFQVVKKVEKLIYEKGENKEYLPVDGLNSFNKASAELLLGEDNALIKQHKVASVQCCGGTGSLRLGAAFIQRFFSGSKVLISSPTWGNHKEILDDARVPWSEYRYCDPITMELDLEGMIADIKDAPNGSFILLQGCAHNPTCLDPTPAQWHQIADLIQRKNHIAFFDFAYQGFASGNLDSDAESLRIFGARGMDVIVAQSYSKNLGLYAERIGALNFICSSSQTCTRVKSQMKWLIIGMYAFPPVHGARIVSTIASNPDLLNEWKEELAAMATSIKIARKRLYESLNAKEKNNKDWSFMLNQVGLFSYPGLNKAQREHMERKWNVYMNKDGSVSLAGMSSSPISDCLAEAIVDSFYFTSVV